MSMPLTNIFFFVCIKCIALHIQRATALSSAAYDSEAGVVIEEGTDSVFLQFATPTNKRGGILFGDPDDADVGYIKYDHGSASAFTIGVAAATRMTIMTDGRVGIATTIAITY